MGDALSATALVLALLVGASASPGEPSPAPASPPSTATSVPAATPIAPAQGAPPASPAPSGAPLRTIFEIRVTTPLCRALLTNASQTTTIEEENDARLATVIAQLRTLDLDSSVLAKARGDEELTAEYVTLRRAAVTGNGLMKEFRKEAKSAPTPEQAKALDDFANALDGALHHQKILADDLGRFIAYLDSHDPITKEEHEDMVFNAILSEGGPIDPFAPPNPIDDVPPQLTTVAQEASKQLSIRSAPIASDEAQAADRMDPAFSDC
ncbi:MAG: hypothetical protein ACREM2_03505 [Vulcanimicrobiaceae bacterium]